MAEWRMPEDRRQLFRIYVDSLYSERWPLPQRRYVFFLILRPALRWAKDAIVGCGLEPDEAESELFLLVDKIFKEYDASKSCLLYHVERHVPWKVSRLLKSLGKYDKEVPTGLLTSDADSYEMNNEVYLAIPGILFEDRWMAKDLSQYEKNLILRVLVEEELDCRSLANSCLASKSAVNNALQNIAGKIEERF